MSVARRLLIALAVLAVGAAVARTAAAEAETAAALPPLTNEDVVRMVAAGKPEREIVQTIGARAEAFELADDLIDELKLAGVPPSIISAMQQRHMKNAPPAAPVDRPVRSHVKVVVTLNAGAASVHTLHAPAWADEDLKASLSLGKENDARAVKDLAVFLACRTPEHIPDLWRSKTPLGRDMVAVGRHEMLAFVAGDTPPGKTPRLTLPAQLEAQVEESEPHDLVLGVAARIGDHWFQLAATRPETAEVTSGSKPLVGHIAHIGNGFLFKVELKDGR